MNSEVEIKIDEHIGEFFIYHLKNSQKRLWVMSPWVSHEYIDLLLDKKKQGVDVKILTSNDPMHSQTEALLNIFENQTRIIRNEKRGLKLFGFAFILLGILGSILIKFWVGILFVLGIILYFLGREVRESFWVSKFGEENLTIFQHHAYHLVHAKVYIIDDMVIIGSSNFTANSLQRSVEGVVIIKNQEQVKKAIEMIESFKNGSSFEKVDHNTVGENIHSKSKQHFNRYYRYKRNYSKY